MATSVATSAAKGSAAQARSCETSRAIARVMAVRSYGSGVRCEGRDGADSAGEDPVAVVVAGGPHPVTDPQFPRFDRSVRGGALDGQCSVAEATGRSDHGAA